MYRDFYSSLSDVERIALRRILKKLYSYIMFKIFG